ncbi:MAG: flagellar export chaperone FlgN [Geobacteraceae bacterium]|nr:flagellar export chaperone FlgN [Geobacteraceae bacterium]
MNNRIDILIQCLREKEALLEKLVLLLDEERTVIVDLDTAGLESKRESKLQLIGLLEQSKVACKNALEDAACELQVTSLVNLSAVLNAAPPARREILLKVQRRLFELTDILNRSNRFNRDLLYGSLSTVNRSLAFINSRLGRAVSTYSNAGSVVTGAAGGRLVSGEI